MEGVCTSTPKEQARRIMTIQWFHGFIKAVLFEPASSIVVASATVGCSGKGRRDEQNQKTSIHSGLFLQ